MVDFMDLESFTDSARQKTDLTMAGGFRTPDVVDAPPWIHHSPCSCSICCVRIWWSLRPCVPVIYWSSRHSDIGSMTWPAYPEIGLGPAHACWVGNMVHSTTAFADLVFSSDLRGHASAGVGMLGMVRPLWCHRSRIVGSMVLGLARYS
jgi:hypothetical protein